MMRRFSVRLREIGAANMVRALALLLILLIALCAGAYAEGNVQDYKNEDFAEYLKFDKNDEAADALLHTISIADCREQNISVQSLLQAFPDYAAYREAQGYAAYNLEGGSRLFVFFEDDVLTNVCRMEPRCTVDAFSAIEKGVSSADDVIGIDKNAVFNPFIQWGPVSYHCLDDGTYYMVQYKQSPEAFTVEDVSVISSEECLSILSAISPEDMPSGN